MNLLKTLGRGLLIVVLLFIMMGFGVCGAYGMFGGVILMFASGRESGFGMVMLAPGAIGLAIGWHAWKGIRAMLPGSRPGERPGAD